MPRIVGIADWDLQREKDFHRTYHISLLVELDLSTGNTGSSPEGPFTAANTPGLPSYGDLWNFNADVDVWAYCKAQVSVKSYPRPVPNQYFVITYLFSTKPDYRCNETSIEDPLLEPPKLSGGFTKYTLEATQDRFGNPIVNSAFEQIRGPQNEWDNNRTTVKIEYPTPTLNLALYTAMMDTVNEFELWGQQPRCIKLSSASWQQVFFGECYVYYRWSLEFDVDPETFDRNFLDQGTKALHGEWRNGVWVLTSVNTNTASTSPVNPNPQNPLHFIQYKDANGENTTVILNGKGVPIFPQAASYTATSFNITFAGGEYQCPSTISLASTSGMSAPGSITITDVNSSGQLSYITIDFTGISGNTITGCTVAEVTGNPEIGSSGIVIAENSPANYDPPYPNPNQPGYIYVQKYNESDFLQLGIPAVLDPYSGL